MKTPEKDASEWVLDYSKWVEDLTLCIYLYSMLENDIHNKLIQGWREGKRKRRHFVLTLLAKLAVARQAFALPPPPPLSLSLFLLK